MAIEKVSPANGPERKQDKQRVPMSTGQQRLSVPEIPGYYLYWFRGEPRRIQQALDAWFTFVTPEETNQRNLSLGGDATVDGNTDLGTRVSQIAGDIGEDGQPVRLYLMKQLQEHRDEDVRLSAGKNKQVLEALQAGMTGAEEDSNYSDTRARYVKNSNTLFQPKPNRS